MVIFVPNLGDLSSLLTGKRHDQTQPVLLSNTASSCTVWFPAPKYWN
jgi:hypothetical protein